MKTEAYFSPDRLFRYWLLRAWDESLPLMVNIGNNPSTADEEKNDPTIRKDMGFATRNGFGQLLKLNVGAYRSTDPKKWLSAVDPFGPENSPDHLKEYISRFKTPGTKVVGAWGRCIGRFIKLGDALAGTLPDLMCFGKNRDGTPKHTLMLPYTTELQPYHVRKPDYLEGL